jgi:hypothetical protein
MRQTARLCSRGAKLVLVCVNRQAFLARRFRFRPAPLLFLGVLGGAVAVASPDSPRLQQLAFQVRLKPPLAAAGLLSSQAQAAHSHASTSLSLRILTILLFLSFPYVLCYCIACALHFPRNAAQNALNTRPVLLPPSPSSIISPTLPTPSAWQTTFLSSGWCPP